MSLDLEYFNGYGGFAKNGTEYVIKLTKGLNTPAPWANVIAIDIWFYNKNGHWLLGLKIVGKTN